MKLIFSFLLLIWRGMLATAIAASWLTPCTFLAQAKVKVHLTYTNSYCGGARPTPEMEEKLREPKNFHDVHVILNGKKHFKAKTDSLGNFTLPLKPGTYKIYLTKFKNEAHYTTYNPSCPQMLKASYGELIVEKDKKTAEANLHIPCNPCEPPRP